MRGSSHSRGLSFAMGFLVLLLLSLDDQYIAYATTKT